MDRRFEFAQTRTSRIVLDVGAEAQLADLVSRLDPDGCVVVHDAGVAELAERIAADLGARVALPVAVGAGQKRLEVIGQLAERLHAADATRGTVLVGIGGGTTTDLVGFLASIYLRGVPFVSCPTTTLAMCDAALGGKNGVDHCGLKNRLGTIRQPDLIVIDTDWLASLPDELFREGLVEVVKKAAVLDASCFEQLESLAPRLLARDNLSTRAAIAMAIDMKMSVVVADEREGNRRRALNSGHTIGHALESLADGRLRHGFAVAMGLIAECRAAPVDAEVTERIRGLLAALGAPTAIPPELADAGKLWELARRDKKAMRGSVPIYVPRRIGEGHLVELHLRSMAAALQP